MKLISAAFAALACIALAQTAEARNTRHPTSSHGAAAAGHAKKNASATHQRKTTAARHSKSAASGKAKSGRHAGKNAKKKSR